MINSGDPLWKRSFLLVTATSHQDNRKFLDESSTQQHLVWWYRQMSHQEHFFSIIYAYCFYFTKITCRVEWGKMPPLRENCNQAVMILVYWVICDGRYDGSKGAHTVQFWGHMFIFYKKNEYKNLVLTVG